MGDYEDFPYIKQDADGNWYNATYPPTCNMDNGLSGYPTANRECLFYDFAVMRYDLIIIHQGKHYYFMVDTDCVWLSDERFTAEIQRYANANEALEQFKINGKSLVELVDELDYCEAV